MTLELTFIDHSPIETEDALPLIIAHGLFGSARNFNTLGKKLATNRRVIVVDMRNHGNSPWNDDVRYEAMAGDLAGVIAREAGGRALILGHSMGGKTAMATALLHPGLVAGALIADIAPVHYTHTHLPYIQAMRAMDLSRITRRSDADPMLANVIPEPMLRAFLLQNLVLEGGRAQWRLNLAALEEGMPHLIGWPSTLAPMSYDGPAFFLAGGVSDYLTQAHHGDARRQFPMAEFQAIEGAGHWLHAEKPAEFMAAVEGWLATQASAV